MQCAGLTTTLHLEPSSARILGLSWRGRATPPISPGSTISELRLPRFGGLSGRLNVDIYVLCDWILNPLFFEQHSVYLILQRLEPDAALR